MQLQANEPLYQIMLARYYEAGVGRFLSSDPGNDTSRSEPQSWNKFAYVRNNPVRRLDPTGKAGIDGGLALYEYQAEAGRRNSNWESDAALLGAIDGVAHETSTAASAIGVVALAAAAVAAFTPGAQPAVVPLLELAGAMGVASTGADSAAAVVNPSEPSLATAGGDFLSIGAGAMALHGTGNRLTAVGRVAAEAVTIPAAAAGTALIDQIGAMFAGSEGASAPAPCPTPEKQPAPGQTPPTVEKKK